MKKITILLYWILIALLAGIASYYVDQSINFVLIGCIVVGCIFSVYKSFEKEGYIGQTLALKDNGRTAVYDYLRVLAVLCVITVHILGLDLTAAADLAGTTLYENLNVLRWWCFNCNMIFVMISGALLLKYKDEGVLHFYLKRATKIIIPLVIYYIWYLWQGDQLAGSTPFQVAVRIFTGDIYTMGANHFWLIYDLLALYLVVPFLRIMLKDMSYKMLSGLMIVLFIVSIVDLYFPSNIAISRPFAGWLAVAIAGFWCAKSETRKYDNWLIIFGIISTILMYFVIKYDSNYQMTLGNLSPYRVAMAVGIFSIFFKLQKYLKNIYIIRLISKYSYGIMLIHLWVIGDVERKLFKISSVMYKGAGLVFSVAMTLLIGILVTYLIENLFTVIFNTIIDKLTQTKKEPMGG